MIFLSQRTGQGKNFFTQLFYIYVNDIFITENWVGRELLHPKFLNMNVSDIFITENWARRELLR